MELSWDQQVAQVLPFVLQHSIALSQPTDICNLLQISTAVRTAVQQSRGNCSVSIGGFDADWDGPRVARFAAWLPGHSGLMSRLRVTVGFVDSSAGPLIGSAMLRALQACASSAPSTAAAAAAAAASAAGTLARQGATAGSTVPAAGATGQQRQKREQQQHEHQEIVVEEFRAKASIRVQPQPLCLDSFRTDVLAHPAALQLLPSFSLRQLVLETMKPTTIDADLCAAVSQMTTLTELRLLYRISYLPSWGRSPAATRLVPLAEALGQLPSLALLQCSGPAAAGQFLPQTLQGLTYQMYEPCAEGPFWRFVPFGSNTVETAGSNAGVDMAGAADFCNLGHLTRLQQLRLIAAGPDVSDVCKVALPLGVSCVDVWGALEVSGLQSARQLKLTLGYQHHLCDLTLSSTSAECLEHLELGLDIFERSGMPWLFSAAAGLSRLTSVSRLHIKAHDRSGESHGTDVPWWACVTALQRLKHLECDVSKVHQADLAHLCVLTGLTQLHLQVSEGLVDAAVGPVLLRLTGLQHLSLQGNVTQHLVPVVAQLVQLCSLRMICQRGVKLSLNDLHMLSPLKQLTSLVVFLGENCTAAAVRTWLADMPHLQAIM